MSKIKGKQLTEIPLYPSDTPLNVDSYTVSATGSGKQLINKDYLDGSIPGTHSLQEVTDIGNVTTDDIEITDPLKGVILTSEECKWRLTVNNHGQLLSTCVFDPISDITGNIALYQITDAYFDTNVNKPEASGRHTNSSTDRLWFGSWFNQMDAQSDDTLLGTTSFSASGSYQLSGSNNATMSYNETINGSDAWMRLAYPDSGSVQTYLFNTDSSHLSGGVVGRTKWQIYVDGPTEATHMDLRDRFNYTWHYYVPIVEGLNTFESIAPHSTYRWSPRLQIVKITGTTVDYTIDAQGEDIYMKNVEYWSINTTHCFWQATGSEVPEVVNNKPIGNGTTDYLEHTQGGILATYSTGTMVFYFEDIEDTGVENLIFSMGDGTTDNFLNLGMNTSDELTITRVTGAGATVSSAFPTTLTRGTWSKVIVKTDGSNYIASQNGVDLGTPTNDNGDWWDYPVGTDLMTIFKKSGSPDYFQGSMGYMHFTHTQTTNSQDLNIREHIDINIV